MCRVLNKRTDAYDGAVYIGRRSKWGNPFVIGRDGTRAEVIAKYAVWLADQYHLRMNCEGATCCAGAPHWPAMAICSRPLPTRIAESASSGGAG